MPAGKSSRDHLHRLFPVGDRGSRVNQIVSGREPLLPAALLDKLGPGEHEMSMFRKRKPCMRDVIRSGHNYAFPLPETYRPARENPQMPHTENETVNNIYTGYNQLTSQKDPHHRGPVLLCTSWQLAFNHWRSTERKRR